MKRWGFLVALLAVRAIAAPHPSPMLPFEPKVARLENGLTVVRIPFPQPGLIAYYTVVRVGSRNEVSNGESRTGFAHFFEHMMFRGTPQHPASERGEALAALGFVDNAFTEDDVTVYELYGPSSAMDTVIALEADRFQHLQYDEPAFRTEALAVLGEYHKSAASPGLKVEEALAGTAFTRHPYRHTVLGFYEDIQKMPEQYAYSRKFFEQWYTPDNTTVIAVGDFDDQALLQKIREHYGTWKGHASRLTIPTEPAQKSARTARVEWTRPTLPWEVIAWKVPASKTDTQDAALMELAGAYLVGPTSPIYRRAVLEKQWAQGIASDPRPHRDPALFIIHVVLKEERFRKEMSAALMAEVKALRSGKVDAKRLSDIQSALRYGTLMQLDRADEVAEQVALYTGIMGQPDALLRHLEHLASATPTQLVAFARKHFRDEERTTVVLTAPPENPSEAKPTDAAGEP